jgi:membrane-bound ClpP family serine protease
MTALGVSLLAIGAIVIAVEAHVPSMGALGGPGVVALGAGAVLAVSGLGGGIVLGIVSAVLLVCVATAVLAVSVGKGLAVRRIRVRTGPEGLVGHVGVVHSWIEQRDDSPAAQRGEAGRRARGEGKVQVDGALWRARRSWGEEDPGELHVGDPVVVEQLSGLTLSVRPAEEWEIAP